MNNILRALLILYAGDATSRQIANEIGLARSWASNLMGRLEDEGLVFNAGGYPAVWRLRMPQGEREIWRRLAIPSVPPSE